MPGTSTAKSYAANRFRLAGPATMRMPCARNYPGSIFSRSCSGAVSSTVTLAPSSGAIMPQPRR